MYAIAGVLIAFLILYVFLGSETPVHDQSVSTSAVNYGGFPSSVVQGLANAIAHAEGFDVPGSVPQRSNNPGDLFLGNKGFGLAGNGETVFDSVLDGWNALYNQVVLMLNGQSAHYSPSETFTQIAATYTGGDDADAWAQTVSGALGLTPENTLNDYLEQTA
jgi:hypothetical protein